MTSGEEMKKMHYFNITYVCDSNCLFCAANIGMINHNNYTMTDSEFEQQLLSESVKPGDYIMISGGEPTVSPYFWKILDICKKYNCNIELTTNGHFFADIEQAKRLYTYQKANVQIPLFGLEIKHDYLTGHVGGFKKTIAALDNFAKLIQNEQFSVSVKFLLCKATVESNIEAYDFCFERYGNKFYYYLNALLVSKKVIANSSELLEPYTVTMNKLGDFVNKDGLIVDTIPLCLLSEKKRNEILKKRNYTFEKVYADAKKKNLVISNYKGQKCEICHLEKHCDKFLPSYIEYFGDNEIKPFTQYRNAS